MLLTGILLNINGINYIRVKADNDDGFEDIKIIHTDLNIIINDLDFTIRLDANGEKYLDHSDETLGY